MANVTPVKASSGGRPQGVFHVEKFSMFDEDDLLRYAEFRNREANKANGIKIENMREYSRKTSTVEGMGDSQVVTNTEEIILVVHYWEREVARSKGGSDEEVRDAKAVLVPR